MVLWFNLADLTARAASPPHINVLDTYIIGTCGEEIRTSDSAGLATCISLTIRVGSESTGIIFTLCQIRTECLYTTAYIGTGTRPVGILHISVI